MKRIFVLTLMAISTVLFIGCARRVSEVTSLQLSGISFQDYYSAGEAVSLEGVNLTAFFDDNTSETFNLFTAYQAGDVSLSGNYVESPFKLFTDVPGTYLLRITYQGITIVVNYVVFDIANALKVGPGETYTTVEAALADATADDTIFIANGKYTLTTGLLLNINGLTIIGQSEDGVFIDISENTLLDPGNFSVSISITGDNITLANLTIQDLEGNDHAFMVRPRGDNITIRNVTVEGPGRTVVSGGEGEPYSWGLSIGGIDGYGANFLTLQSVTVKNISRNAIGLNGVTNAVLTDIHVLDSGHPAGGGAAIALYRDATLLQLTGVIENVNFVINASPDGEAAGFSPFNDFEFGDLTILGTALAMYALEAVSTSTLDSFAVNVLNAYWRVEFAPSVYGYYISENDVPEGSVAVNILD